VSFITSIGYPDHHVWLSAPVQELLAALEDDRDAGFVSGVRRLNTAMRDICSRLGVTDTVTPHDLRRTFATRAAMPPFVEPIYEFERLMKTAYKSMLPWITSMAHEPPIGWLPDEGRLNIVQEEDLPDIPLPPPDKRQTTGDNEYARQSRQALKRSRCGVMTEGTSGDYNALLATAMRWVSVS